MDAKVSSSVERPVEDEAGPRLRRPNMLGPGNRGKQAVGEGRGRWVVDALVAKGRSRPQPPITSRPPRRLKRDDQPADDARTRGGLRDPLLRTGRRADRQPHAALAGNVGRYRKRRRLRRLQPHAAASGRSSGGGASRARHRGAGGSHRLLRARPQRRHTRHLPGHAGPYPRASGPGGQPLGGPRRGVPAPAPGARRGGPGLCAAWTAHYFQSSGSAGGTGPRERGRCKVVRRHVDTRGDAS